MTWNSGEIERVRIEFVMIASEPGICMSVVYRKSIITARPAYTVRRIGLIIHCSSQVPYTQGIVQRVQTKAHSLETKDLVTACRDRDFGCGGCFHISCRTATATTPQPYLRRCI